MKRYAWLLAFGVVLSLGALVVARTVRFSAPALEVAAELDTVELALSVGVAGVEPATAAVPKDHRVTLAIRNQRPAPVTITLQGYEDRLTAGPIAPGDTWHGEFVSDRPGEAFAWVADGVATGRLSVTGSHLVEGHR